MNRCLADLLVNKERLGSSAGQIFGEVFVAVAFHALVVGIRFLRFVVRGFDLGGGLGLFRGGGRWRGRFVSRGNRKGERNQNGR